MTVLNIASTGTPLIAGQKAAIAEQVTAAFALVEVGVDAPSVLPGFMIRFETVAPDDLWVGGKSISELSEASRAALVTVRVMAGPWNDEMKAELLSKVEAIIRKTANMPREGNGQDIWTTFLEVPDGGWGLGGSPVRIEQLAPFSPRTAGADPNVCRISARAGPLVRRAFAG